MKISGRFGTSRLERSRMNTSRLSPLRGIVEAIGPSFSIVMAGLDNGYARIGTQLTASAANYSDGVPGSIVWTWNNVLGTPSGANYTPVVGDDLSAISVTATASEIYDPRTSASYTVTYVPPVTAGTLSDVNMTHTAASAGLGDMNSYFTGSDLTFSVSGYPGVSIVADNLIVDPTDAVANQVVTVTASNSGGSADLTFDLTVVTLAFTAANFNGSGKIGSVHTASATVNRPGAVFAYDYERDGVSIGAANQATYTPVAGDDLTDLSVVITATVDGLQISTEPAAIAITYVVPAANGSIPNQSYTQGVAITPLDTSAYFTGSDLTFALAPSSAALPAGLSLSSSGSLTGTPTALVTNAVIVVRGTNSGGFVDRAFQLTVADAVDAPVLSGLDASGAPDALELDVDIACDLYWSLDPVGTNPDGDTIIAGGITDSGGPDAISSGANVIAFDFSAIAAGTYDLSFVASNSGALSNVLRQEITLADAGTWAITGSELTLTVTDQPTAPASPTITGGELTLNVTG